MSLKNTTDRYGSLSVGLHWLMLLLLVAVYAAINLQDAAPKGSELRADLRGWHIALGIGVLALVLTRLAARLFAGPAPAITPAVPRWQERSARAMHLALYAFLLAMPLLGWLSVNAKGYPVDVLGLNLPVLVGKNDALHDTMEDIHEVMGTLGYYLIGLHAAAALVHHYVMRDNTLRRMLPAWRRRPWAT